MLVILAPYSPALVLFTEFASPYLVAVRGYSFAFRSLSASYSHLSTFMVAGVSQINFQVAAYAPSWAPNNPITLNLLSSVQSLEASRSTSPVSEFGLRRMNRASTSQHCLRRRNWCAIS